jgi:hypothetical protein
MSRMNKKTAAYNPHLLGRDALIAGFVARRPLLEQLLDDVRRGGKQHHLLLGSRGSGKTTLLLRLAYAIEDDPNLSRTAVALRFPEEQYNVARPSDFWLNCVDALIDALEREGKQDMAKKLDAAIAELEGRDEDEREAAGRALLLQFGKQARRRLILLVDNIDIVLQRLKDHQWPLREHLSGDNALTLICGSSTMPAEVVDYQSAFYDFFNVHELGPLSETEARELLLQLAEQTGTPEVRRSLDKDPGRFKTLFVLTGGTPRTLVLLHGVLVQEKDARVEDDLEGLLDQVTPYYKARFDDLPAQSQIIVDAMALHWHPITAAQCAEKTHLELNLVSALLNRLVRSGVVGKVSFPDSSKLAFQLDERFFNIWYLMRASRRLRRRLGWLVEFLRSFYGEEEIEKRAKELLDTHSDPAKLLAYAAAIDDLPLRRQLEFRAVQRLVDEVHSDDSLRELLDLQGEDAHLVPVLDRRRAMLELRRKVMSCRSTWPKGVKPADVAELVAKQSLLPMAAKFAWVNQLSRATNASVKEQLSKLESHKTLSKELDARIARGELPSLLEVTSVAEIEDIASLSEIGLLLAGMFATSAEVTFWDRLASLAEIAQAGILINAGIRAKGGDVERSLFLVERVVRHGDYAKMATHSELWKELVERGAGLAAAELFSAAGQVERYEPLYQALLAAHERNSNRFARLAPEIATPARQLFTEITAAKQPSAKPPASKVRRPYAKQKRKKSS